MSDLFIYVFLIFELIILIFSIVNFIIFIVSSILFLKTDKHDNYLRNIRKERASRSITVSIISLFLSIILFLLLFKNKISDWLHIEYGTNPFGDVVDKPMYAFFIFEAIMAIYSIVEFIVFIVNLILFLKTDKYDNDLRNTRKKKAVRSVIVSIILSIFVLLLFLVFKNEILWWFILKTEPIGVYAGMPGWEEFH